MVVRSSNGEFELLNSIVHSEEKTFKIHVYKYKKNNVSSVNIKRNLEIFASDRTI